MRFAGIKMPDLDGVPVGLKFVLRPFAEGSDENLSLASLARGQIGYVESPHSFILVF